MYTGFLTIFAALFVGYLIPLKDPKLTEGINHLVNSMVYMILALMGANLSTIDNLFYSIDDMLIMTAVFFIAIGFCNLLVLPLLDWYHPVNVKKEIHSHKITAGFSETIKVILSLVAGFLLGLLFKPDTHLIEQMSGLFLHVLLFFIGIQLRCSDISLRQILLNKPGLFIAFVVMATSLMGGVIAASILGLPVMHGLAMASGFGWYSLAGILITDAYGPIFGAVSFLNEVLREMTAFMLIPMVIRRFPHTAIGYGGATTLDFTLPIIQSQGGIAMVPMAIVSGFVLSVAVPLLMGLFVSFS